MLLCLYADSWMSKLMVDSKTHHLGLGCFGAANRGVGNVGRGLVCSL